MYVTLELTFPCLHIDGRIMFWISNNLTLTLRDTKERTPKVTVTKIYSVAFNHDTEFDADHDAEILCKRIKQSDWFWEFCGRCVFHYSWAGGGTPNFCILPMKASLPLLLVEVGDYSLKTKNGNKDFQQQNKSIFLGNLCSFFSLWCTFSQELTIDDHESLLQAEKF